MSFYSNKYFSICALILSGFILSACGDGRHHNSSRTSATPRAGADQFNEGIYRANLGSLNTTVAGNTTGIALIRVDGNFAASVGVVGAPVSVAHRQYITMGFRCPTTADDADGDGYLDSVEVAASSGKNLIPLDSDLSAQTLGTSFPTSSSSGSYLYNKSTLLDLLLADLFLEDTNLTDYTGKLAAEGGLNLAGKVVIIQSVSSSHVFPPTVSTTGGSTSRTLPIACGILEKVADSTSFPLPTPPAPWPWQTSFSTRLSNELLIAGSRCTGTETTEATVNGHDITFNCPKGKWLVIVDNINRCSDQGICTEIALRPIVSDLRRANVVSAGTLAFYNLIPLRPTNSGQSQIMKKHWVRFDTNGDPVVLEK